MVLAISEHTHLQRSYLQSSLSLFPQQMLAVTFIAIILGIINAHPFDELHQYVDDHVEDYVEVSFDQVL